MIFDEESRQQCLPEGRSLAIRRRLCHLQSDMEMYFLNIKKREVLIESFASMYVHLYSQVQCIIILDLMYFYVASSKQRPKLQYSLPSEKTKLGVSVANYNSLADMVDGFPTTSVDEVINGEFPWSLLAGKYLCVACKITYYDVFIIYLYVIAYKGQHHSIQKKLEIVELFNEMK